MAISKPTNTRPTYHHRLVIHRWWDSPVHGHEIKVKMVLFTTSINSQEPAQHEVKPSAPVSFMFGPEGMPLQTTIKLIWADEKSSSLATLRVNKSLLWKRD